MSLRDKLDHLKEQKNDLVDNLVSKGVSANYTEKFDELVPKVKLISQSGGPVIHGGNADDYDLLFGKIAYVEKNGTIKELNGKIPTYRGNYYITPDITSNNSDIALQTEGCYMTGDIILPRDENFKAENIKKGVTIYNITGTLETTDPGSTIQGGTAKASDIILGKTAFVEKNGSVQFLTGSLPIYDEKNFDKSEDLVYNNGIYIMPEQESEILYTANTKVEKNIFIQGDKNLKPENIVSGVTIFNVAGTAQIFASDENKTNATKKSLMTGKYIITNGNRIDGELDLHLLSSLTSGNI